jgi:uncharacterized protein (DUF4415 family)
VKKRNGFGAPPLDELKKPIIIDSPDSESYARKRQHINASAVFITRSMRKERKGMKAKKVNFPNIPGLSDKQLVHASSWSVKVGDEPRKLIAVRVDAKVLGSLRKTGEKSTALLVVSQRNPRPRDAVSELAI